MIRSGEVVEAKDDLLTVVFERPATCENCGACLSKRCTYVELPGKARVGDAVEVAMPDKSVVGASAIAYGIPVVLLLAGLVLGAALHGPLGVAMSQDVFAALSGGVLLIIGWLVVRGIDRILRKKQDWQPKIVAIHPGGTVQQRDTAQENSAASPIE